MPNPVPERFLVSKATLRFDRFMTGAIRVGGGGIIVAVFGIFVFIFIEIIPLFQRAKVAPGEAISLASPESTPSVGAESASGEPVPTGRPPRIFGLDESSKLPFTYDGGREIRFHDRIAAGGVTAVPVELPPESRLTALRYKAPEHRVVFGTADGRVGYFTVVYDTLSERPTASVEMGAIHQLGTAASAVLDVDFGGTEDQMFAVLQEVAGRPELHVLLLEQKRGLLANGKLEVVGDLNLTHKLRGEPRRLLVPSTGDAVVVSTTANTVEYFFRVDDQVELRQEFSPLGDAQGPAGVASMDFIFGDVSLIFTGTTGEMRMWSLNVPPNGESRLFAHTKTFAALPGPATFFAASQDKKSFLVGSGTTASLRHATTAAVRWEETLPFAPKAALIDAKSAHLAFLDSHESLHLYQMSDPHPEAGLRAFFGPIWYEGYSEPRFEWQSTSGNQEFEPKLSLVPLIHGTLKGTLWAMVFAVPVALLAAIYTAQFLRPEYKRVVKPVMEIMASLPSVVLGFLAALWLAPRLESRVPSLMLVCLGVPLATLLMGWSWARLPARIRRCLKPGLEWMALMPLAAVMAAALWSLGPVAERAFFDGDFRQWWPRVTGASFDQRNSLVVGFMMGFAVIPIIFTIAEDALSSVPPSLTAASAALGASRWQTVQAIVLPIASAGIFSALMVGLGRAVGETMIVVMATGNTPIMDWNIFNGMRTLSANIAVELPEAAVHSTHYRTLFLGALVLFLMTFILNTIAELLRQRLREKYKLV